MKQDSDCSQLPCLVGKEYFQCIYHSTNSKGLEFGLAKAGRGCTLVSSYIGYSKYLRSSPQVPIPTESKGDSSHLVISAGFLSLSGGFSCAVGCLA